LTCGSTRTRAWADRARMRPCSTEVPSPQSHPPGASGRCGTNDRPRPRPCENSFRSPRRIANRRIRCDKSPEIGSTWLKFTPKNGARAFSHTLDPELPDASPDSGRWQVKQRTLTSHVA
jgi:hypothetical protein